MQKYNIILYSTTILMKFLSNLERFYQAAPDTPPGSVLSLHVLIDRDQAEPILAHWGTDLKNEVVVVHAR